MAENTIDNLSIQVVASAERAISTFNRLASGASGLRGAVRGAAGGMQDMAQGARDAGTATQEAGTQAGSATISVGRFWNALRGVGSRIGGFFVQAVHRGTAAVGTFLKSIARIAFYRAIRSIIKDLGQSFKDLYGYSRLFGTDFAKSMDRITTASVYLRNSFAAMVAPLVNMFAPALDMLADKIVDILNFVNQLFAAINGQETYTVAKKVATTWESTFDSAANHATKRIKEVRNTLLGFDEINRLNGETPTTSGSTGSSPYTPGYSTMFEEKPLEGFFKKISDFTSGMPDWLKWLLGGTALVGGFLLIKKFIPWLLKKIGELFAFKIPDWIKWLFGPKGDGDGGLDIPKDIDLPDGEITVDLKQGDWSVLNDITGKDLPVNIVPSQSAKSLFDTLVNAWNDIPGKTLFVNVALSQKAAYLWKTLQSAWDGIQNKVLYADVMLSQKANYLWTTLSNAWDGIQNKVLYVEVMLSQKATYLWTTLQSAWDNIQNKVLYANVSLSQKATYLWDTLKNAWNGIQGKVVYANVSLSQSANYLWTTLKNAWNGIQGKVVYLTVEFTQKANYLWTTLKNAWDGIQNKVFYVEVELKKKDWTTITDFVDDSFGGATGGGGKTSGGGVGRTYGVDTKLNTPTDATLKDWWNATTTYWGKLLQAGGVAGMMVALKEPGEDGMQTLATKIGEAWDALLQANKLTYGVIIQPVANKAGQVLSSMGNKIGSWLFGSNETPHTDIALDATPGSGFNETLGKNKFALGGIEDASVNVGLQRSWLGTPEAELGVDNLQGTVTMSLGKEKNWAKDGWKKTLGLKDKTATITTSLKKVKDWKEKGLKEYLEIKGKSTTITAKLDPKWDISDPLKALNLKDLTAVIKTKLKKEDNNKVTYSFKGGGTGKGVVVGEIMKHGGVFSNGAWSRIPQYAGGTTNAHGSLFLAGEAGPEVVGHVGGRTEVLNKSQIASAMYSAVQAAMAPAAANFASAAQSMGVESVGFDLETLAEMVRQGVEQAMGRQNELDRQRNEYLRQINEKDYNPEISTSSINKAQQRMNRRAGTTIVPVGT